MNLLDMPAQTTVEITYDPYDPRMQQDPWATFKQLRDDAPVYHNPELDLWVLSRYDDVREAAKDFDRYSSAQGVTALRDPDTGKLAPAPIGPGDFLEMDPPGHDQLRKIVRPYFTPQAVGELERNIGRIADELIDDVIADGEADFGSRFGGALPSRVITHMLGLSPEDAPKLSHWIHLCTDTQAPGQDHAEWAAGVMEGAGAMWMFLAEQLEQRRAEPRQDMMTDIAHATIDGKPLGDSAVGMCFLLYGAGEDTTAGLITTMVKTLAESESHREQLAGNLELMPSAIDEFLRWDGPFLHLARALTEDVAVRDVTIPSGSRLLLLWSAANRDERAFADPDTLDFTRRRVAHLGFGHGLHHCIGHALAKLEARVAMTRLLTRIPDFSIAGEPVFVNKAFMRSYRHLPVSFPAGGRS